MTASSDRSKGHSHSSPSGRDGPPDRTVEDGEVSRAAKSGFEGWLVSKPRARRFSSRHSVPHHVVEWILSRHRAEGASGTEAARKARELLSERLAEAEDIELLKMEASTEGSVRVIDEVEGAFDERLGEPVLTFSELGLNNVPVDKEIAEDHPQLLKGGFYAHVQLSYVGESDSGSPFRAAGLRPLAPSGTDLLERLSAGRRRFSDAAWFYFLVRSVGLAAPSEKVGPRTAALALLRLVPLVQKRYSLVELGPRGTEKAICMKT